MWRLWFAWLWQKINDFFSIAYYFIFPVKPFASEHEFHTTAAIVKRFAEGTGQHLHQRLLQRAKSRRNWVTLTCQNLDLRSVRLSVLALTWLITRLYNYMNISIPVMNLYESFPVTWLAANLPAVCLAGGMVVGHCIFGSSHAVSALCELRRSRAVPGALLAGMWWDTVGEDQFGDVAHASVLGPHPHVSITHYSLLIQIRHSGRCRKNQMGWESCI